MPVYTKHLMFLHLLFILSLFSLLSGCASPGYRLHPEFELKIKSLEKPVLMPPEVKVYESLPGGVVVLRDDWSVAGSQNLSNAVVTSFRGKNYSVSLLDSDAKLKEELEEVQSLYTIVNKSIRLQAYGSPSASQDHCNFEYSLGSLENILRKFEADSMIFVSALEQIDGGESKAVVNLAVADPSGTIIWYSLKGWRGKYALTNSESAVELIKDLIFFFPNLS